MKQLTLFPQIHEFNLDSQKDLTIASWNVNSVRARLNQIVAWIRKVNPGILCLQETKVTDNLFPEENFLAEGYHSAIFGQTKYNGVAILSKYDIENPIKGLRENNLNEQARIISAKICGINIICLYAPDARSINHESFSYKLNWFNRLDAYLKNYYKKEEDIIVCGDFNIAPTDVDVYDPDLWICKTYIHPKIRSSFKKIESWGLVDFFQILGESKHSFTWWDYKEGFIKNKGMRLDHILGSEGLVSRLTKIWVDKEVRSLPKPSDHAPIICTLSKKI